MASESFVVRTCAARDIRAVEACSRHVFPRHTHDEYGIGLIVGGAHRSWSGRGTVEAGCGSIITCNPGEVHDGAPIGDSRAWKMLYLAPPVVAAIVDDMRDAATAQFEFTAPVIGQRLQALAFESAYRALTGRCADPELAQERLMLLFAGLLHRKPVAPSRVPAGLSNAKARIDDDPSKAVTLAELAREAGVSRFQLLRGFARLTGLTPHAYIVQRRVEAARALIAQGATIADAAAACAFSDQSHFNRAFVDRFGFTPGAYARALR